MKTIKQLIEIAEKLGWSANYIKEDKEFELEAYSPADQDFLVYLNARSPKEMMSSLEKRIIAYDPWEEAQLWIRNGKGQNGAPENPEDVLADMKACKQMMSDLLKTWKENKTKKISSYDICISPVANIQAHVKDPLHPTIQETEMLTDMAIEKIRDNLEYLLIGDNLEFITLVEDDIKKEPLIWYAPVYPYPDCTTFNKAYKGQTQELLYKALGVINNYKGDKLVKLPSGEKAVDFDDAWIIIRKEGSFLRDKRLQRMYDPKDKASFKKKSKEEDICLATLAQELASNYEVILDIADFLS